MKEIYAYVGISRQGHFKSLRSMSDKLNRVPLYEALIELVRDIHPGMSLRKIYEKTQPEGIGRDAFIELGLSLGYRLRSAINKARTTWSVKSKRYQNLLYKKRFTDVNQIWSSDITYFLLNEVYVYIVLIMDVYSRRIIGYVIAKDLRAIHNIKALEMALALRGIDDYAYRLIHHSDRGSQYLSNAYTELLDQHHILISTCNSVFENTHIERVNGTIKNQYLKRWEIHNFPKLKRKLKDTIYAYNFDRPHDGLKGKTPVEFENYIKDIPIHKRPKLQIFTMQKPRTGCFNPNQLFLNF